MENRKKLKNKKRIVIKIGTSSLTYPNGRLNFHRIEKLAQVLSDLTNQGRQILLVSSGAIGVGSGRLGLRQRPDTLPGKQATAAIGQCVLMKIYQKFFDAYNQIVAQILITKDGMVDLERRRNAKNTLETLLDMNVIPIINENDTISTAEIEFGDNDTLSASVAALVDADLLIMLTDIDGLFSEDPRKNASAKIISTVKEITHKIEESATGAGSTYGKGGMSTKIAAAKICSESNIDTIIANGNDPAVIYNILAGKKEGTLFLSKEAVPVSEEVPALN